MTVPSKGSGHIQLPVRAKRGDDSPFRNRKERLVASNGNNTVMILLGLALSLILVAAITNHSKGEFVQQQKSFLFSDD